MIDVLIIGGDSLIGQSLLERIRVSGRTVEATTRRLEKEGAARRYLDLSKSPFADLSAATVVMCAGVTNLQRCEAEPFLTGKINVDATCRILEAAHARGSRVIYLSSHAVFDGTQPNVEPWVPANALIEYGRQKAIVEQTLLRLGSRVGIVRMTKVVSCRIPLIAGWLNSLEAGRSIAPFADLSMSPISLNYLVSVIADNSLEGIVQVSSEHQMSYAEFAFEMVSRLGFSKTLVSPTRSIESGVSILYRPKFTSLGMSDSRARYGITEQTLAQVLTDLQIEYSTLPRKLV